MSLQRASAAQFNLQPVSGALAGDVELVMVPVSGTAVLNRTTAAHQVAAQVQYLTGHRDG